MDHDRVGIFEAKAHFSEIVDRVLREGRTITVTRRGEPVVEISPISEGANRLRMSREDAVAALEELRSRVLKMTEEEIATVINEGRDRCPST